MGTPNLPQAPVARNVLSVLRYVAAQVGPVGVAAIARDVDLPRFPIAQLVVLTKRTAHVPSCTGARSFMSSRNGPSGKLTW